MGERRRGTGVFCSGWNDDGGRKGEGGVVSRSQNRHVSTPPFRRRRRRRRQNGKRTVPARPPPTYRPSRMRRTYRTVRKPSLRRGVSLPRLTRVERRAAGDYGRGGDESETAPVAFLHWAEGGGGEEEEKKEFYLVMHSHRIGLCDIFVLCL